MEVGLPNCNLCSRPRSLSRAVIWRGSLSGCFTVEKLLTAWRVKLLRSMVSSMPRHAVTIANTTKLSDDTPACCRHARYHLHRKEARLSCTEARKVRRGFFRSLDEVGSVHIVPASPAQSIRGLFPLTPVTSV